MFSRHSRVPTLSNLHTFSYSTSETETERRPVFAVTKDTTYLALACELLIFSYEYFDEQYVWIYFVIILQYCGIHTRIEHRK